MSIPESAPPTRRVGRAMAWGVAIGVGAMVLRELVRPREQAARLIDCERVEQIALNRCGEAADLPEDATREQTYQAIAAELEPLLVEALGPGTASPGSRLYPGLTAVGRRQWVRFNIRIFRQMFEPLEHLQQLIPGSLILSFARKASRATWACCWGCWPAGSWASTIPPSSGANQWRRPRSSWLNPMSRPGRRKIG